MPITFTIFPEEAYYIARFTGHISDNDMVEAYKAFFESDDWSPVLNELTDLSEAELKDVSAAGIGRLAALIEGYAKEFHWQAKVAVYAPNDLPYGLSRMYSAKAERFESHQVFRDLYDAKAWLTTKEG